MKISLENTRQFAKDFLAILERDGISNVKDLQEKVGYTLPFDNDAFVVVTCRPSTFKTLDYVLSFVVPQINVPVEVRINPKMDYSKVLLTSGEEIPGYFIFSRDAVNNLRLMKTLEKADMDVVRKELESL